MADCDRFVQVLIGKHGGVDFLINNAGRSIREGQERQAHAVARGDRDAADDAGNPLLNEIPVEAVR
jgi:NAD(P)-dependent dehydrogenase (short-subunit alcohol dehydrogenase family)